MGIREQMLFLGFILFVIIALSLSMPSVTPYHKDSLFSNEYPYEGFGPLANSVLEGNESNVVNKPIVVNKVEGFEGLQPSPLNNSETLDIFSKFSGNMNCTPTSYSNSKGYLCMDDAATKLLLSRGGNAAGPESQIG
jgi:hypothetical protein